MIIDKFVYAFGVLLVAGAYVVVVSLPELQEPSLQRYMVLLTSTNLDCLAGPGMWAFHFLWEHTFINVIQRAAKLLIRHRACAERRN